MPGMVASGIRRELPWLKLVVSMREPISTAISGAVHRMGTWAAAGLRARFCPFCNVLHACWQEINGDHCIAFYLPTMLLCCRDHCPVCGDMARLVGARAR